MDELTLRNVTSVRDRVNNAVAKTDPNFAKTLGILAGASTIGLAGKKIHDIHKAKKDAKRQITQPIPWNPNVSPRYSQMSEPVDSSENRYKDAIVTAIIASAVGAGASGLLTPISDTVRGATSKLIDKAVPGVRDYGYKNNPTKVPYKPFEVKDVLPQHHPTSSDRRDEWLKDNLSNATIDDLARYTDPRNNIIPKDYQVKVDQLKRKLQDSISETGDVNLTLGEIL